MKNEELILKKQDLKKQQTRRTLSRFLNTLTHTCHFSIDKNKKTDDLKIWISFTNQILMKLPPNNRDRMHY